MKNNYNTFVVIHCKTRKIILVTSSARKANDLLVVGNRVEVWNANQKLETIRNTDRKREPNPLGPYIQLEKDYIGKKQKQATARNAQRNKVKK